MITNVTNKNSWIRILQVICQIYEEATSSVIKKQARVIIVLKVS